eukprot:scaffold3495_cov152-Chaetoceros_neogracile.AAC.1
MVEHAKLPLFKEYQLMSVLLLMIIWEIKYDMKEALQHQTFAISTQAKGDTLEKSIKRLRNRIGMLALLKWIIMRTLIVLEETLDRFHLLQKNAQLLLSWQNTQSS